MAPLFVQFLATLIARLFTSWRHAAGIGIAVMFLFTGATHFSVLRHDMAAMIPPPFTGSLALIYATGVLEIVGAIGLLTRRWRTLSAWSLAALLVALFPANVYAAVADVTFSGQPATPLWIRGPMQLLWIMLLLRVAQPRLPGFRSHFLTGRSSEWLAHRDGIM
jgi:uncharacterized membrane protein